MLSFAADGSDDGVACVCVCPAGSNGEITIPNAYPARYRGVAQIGNETLSTVVTRDRTQSASQRPGLSELSERLGGNCHCTGENTIKVDNDSWDRWDASCLPGTLEEDAHTKTHSVSAVQTTLFPRTLSSSQLRGYE